MSTRAAVQAFRTFSGHSAIAGELHYGTHLLRP